MNSRVGLYFLLLFLIGCADTTQLTSPDNAENAVRYFQRQFITPKAQFSKYTKVYVQKVVFKDMENGYKYDPVELERLSGEFKEEIENKLSSVFTVVHSRSLPDTQLLIIEPKLLLIGTPKRLLNAVTTIAVFIPFTSGSAAFEARLEDGATHQLIAEISDQQTTPMDIKSLTIGNFQKFTHAEAAFKNWAKRLAEMLYNKKHYAAF